MPSPNRNKPKFPCPECGHMCGVQSGASPNTRKNRSDKYRWYRRCPIHGAFATFSNGPKCEGDSFGHFSGQGNGKKYNGGRNGRVIDMESLTCPPHLVKQIIRSKFSPSYFPKGINKDELNTERLRAWLEYSEKIGT